MTERTHPILFSAPMVRAMLSGRKVQTRRVVSAINSLVDGCAVGHRGAKVCGRPASVFWAGLDWSGAWRDAGPSPAGNPGPYLHVPFPAEGGAHRIYPQWQPHDVLWVRETWGVADEWQHGVVTDPPRTIAYRADLSARDFDPEFQVDTSEWGWERMKWRSPIFMPRWTSRLTLRVTGVRVERLQEISKADVIAEGIEGLEDVHAGWHEPYAALWDSINGRGAWAANPYVWILDFVRIHRAVMAA